MNTTPKIAVLMATYNGGTFLAEQVQSILNQVDVSVTVFVSDDSSSDGSRALIQSLANADKRIILLPEIDAMRAAGKNFYRLISAVDVSAYDYVAFSDQDDVWNYNKLSRHVELIQKHGVDGVSSNVMAFWPDGKQKLINKSQPQRELDFLFESAGPGCTFLMTPRLINEVKKLLLDLSSPASQVVLHDWLVYAVCRASGKKWLIDSVPSLQYRQHAHNVVGANNGFKAKLVRFRKITEGWYRSEVLKIVRISCDLSGSSQLEVFKMRLMSSRLLARLRLLKFIPQLRRKRSDRVVLALMVVLGLF